ncbi:alpha/beta fold hydrolase [Sorangium sp. So ce269]
MHDNPRVASDPSRYGEPHRSSAHHPHPTIVDIVRRTAAAHPERPAFRFTTDGLTDDAVLTYGDLDRQARALAALLRSLGGAGERAMLLYPSGPEYVSAFLGCLYAGAPAVPVYPPHPARLHRELPRLEALARDARPALGLTTSALLPMVDALASEREELRRVRWIATDAVDAAGADGWTRPALGAETLAFLQYTSGSTGTPRGVMLTHGNLMHNLDAMHVLYETDASTRTALWLPLYHDMGLIGGLLGTLYIGGAGTILSPLSFLERPLRWLQAIARTRATHASAPDFAYRLCARKIRPEERAGLDLSSWVFALSGAEPVRAETIDAFVEAFSGCGFRREAFYPAYGLAEATVLATGGKVAAPPVVRTFDGGALSRRLVRLATKDGGDARPLVGCGQPPPDHRLAIVHPDTLAPCPAGEVGEIWLAGPSVAQGYWEQPEATRRTFAACVAGTGEGPFLRTGDLGFMHDGELFVCGRLKDLIVIRGLNHYPQDIEATVAEAHRLVRPGCTAALAVARGGEEHLVVVTEVDTRALAEDGEPRARVLDEIVVAIRRAVGERHGVAPSQVVLIKAGTIPKTSSGKLQRQATRAALADGQLEAALASAWTAPEPPPAARPDEGPLARLRLALGGARRAALLRYLVEQVAAITRRPPRDDAGRLRLHELGIDSLAILELLSRLEDDLGVKLPAVAAFEQPLDRLVDHLVTHARADRAAAPAPRATAMLELRPVEARRPLFFVGGMLGSPLYLMPLARAMRRPFHGFPLPGWDGKEPPLRRVEDIAARFVQEIRALQPEGPYQLGGHSFGGLVAYEAGRQLRAGGHEVAAVLLVDTILVRSSALPADSPAAVTIFELAALMRQFHGRGEAIGYDAIASLSSEEQLELLRRALAETEAISPEIRMDRLIETYEANLRAMAAYQPPPSDLRVTLLRAEEPNPPALHASRGIELCVDDATLGWGRVRVGSFDPRRAPGDHVTMVRPPHAERLGQLLETIVGDDVPPTGLLGRPPVAAVRPDVSLAGGTPDRGQVGRPLFDPFDPDFLRDPYPAYARLRREAPVHWSSLSMWLVTRFRDVAASLRDPRLSSDSRNAEEQPGRRLLAEQRGMSPSALSFWIRSEASTPVTRIINNMMPVLDPPRHTRMRALVAKAFTPAVVERSRQQIRQEVEALLARARASGEADLIQDLALPLPIRAISRMLGLPLEDASMLQAWADTLAPVFDHLLEREAFERANEVVPRFIDYIRAEVERRKRAPADDLLTLLGRAEVDGERLTPDETVANAISFFLAGFETTSGALGNSILALHRHPDQRELLRASPDRVPAAVEELLRFDTSFPAVLRTALQDIELGGKAIRRGDLVLLMLAAANRDPDEFPDPDRLDVRRTFTRHLAFGQGPHFCIGAPLARMQLQEAVRLVCCEAGDMRVLEQGIAWRSTLAVRSLARLPVRFDAGGVAPRAAALATRPAAAPRAPRPVHAYVELDDVRLHYVAQGVGGLVVFLHGFPDFWYLWRRQLEELGREHMAVAPDLRGFNLSSKPAAIDAYRMTRLVDDVLALAESLGRRKLTLVGHDLGGMVAWSFAARYPEYLDRLVIVNAPHPAVLRRELRRNPAQRAALAYVARFRAPDAEQVLAEGGYASLLQSRFGEREGRRPVGPEEREAYLAAWAQPGALAGALSYYRVMGDTEVFPEEGATPVIQTPTLVLWGERDRMSLPGNLDGLGAYVTDLKIVRIPEGGHWWLDDADLLNAHLRAFLAS